jgi:nicotinamide-nucleotide adenylyltransferase
MVGRFQGLHEGHQFLIEHLKLMSDRILIYIGSSQESGTKRNPFSYDLRKRMIEAVYGDSVIVKPLPDLTNENDISTEWGEYVFNNVKKDMGKTPDIMIHGNESARNGWYTEKQLGYTVSIIVPKSCISATLIRNYIIQNDIEEFRKFTPKEIWKFFDEMRHELLLIDYLEKMEEGK